MTDSTPRVFVTGTGWIGTGLGSIATATDDLLALARNEILIASYAIGVGAFPFLRKVIQRAEAGLSVRLVINRVSHQPPDVRTILLDGVRQHARLRIYDFEPGTAASDLHAKVLVVDRAAALVGSANLSRSGFVSNHELAVLVHGASAEAVGAALVRLMSSHLCRPLAPRAGPPH